MLCCALFLLQDTVVVPAGGYVVLRFVTTNPGVSHGLPAPIDVGANSTSCTCTLLG